jgi:Skp family chaperone for outer membrane proteins
MGGLEFVLMATSLVLMAGAVIAKLVTTQLVGHMNRQISQVGQVKQEALGRLKTAQSQKAIIEQNQRNLDAKKKKLEKKMDRLRDAMDELKQDEQARRQRSAIRKVDLEEPEAQA